MIIDTKPVCTTTGSNGCQLHPERGLTSVDDNTSGSHPGSESVVYGSMGLWSMEYVRSTRLAKSQ